MQRTYDRALAMYGRDAGCYVPPKMLEEDLKENLRFVRTGTPAYSDSAWRAQKCHCKRMSLYLILFATRRPTTVTVTGNSLKTVTVSP